LGCQGLYAKIRLERSEVWRLWQKPGGLDLYCPKLGFVLAALSLLDFLFFLSVNILLKKSLLYLSFEFIDRK